MTKRKMLPPSFSKDPHAAARVLRQFRMIFNAVRGHFRQVERDAGIGGAQLWALGEIAANNEMSVNELASALDIHQSTASNLVRVLVSRHLIKTCRDADDRRSTLLQATEEGFKLLESAPMPFKGVLPATLEGLDPTVLARLENDLALLLSSLEADGNAAKTPLADL